MADTLSLRALQAFEAAARLGSFARAAEELGISPAAVSQLIRGLEEQTGRRLFDRAKRSIQLNEAGREALPRLTAAFQDIRETSQILHHRVAQSRLVVSVPPSVATSWLPRRLPEFLVKEPNVSLRTREDHGPLDLEAERIDIRLSYGSFPNEVARIVSEVSDDVVAVCTKAYFDDHNCAADLGFFSTARLIETDWGGVAASFPSWTEFLGEPPSRQTHIVASSHAALSMAKAGLGVALVQKLYAAEPLRRGDLVLASPKRLAMPQSYCLSVRQAVSTRPMVVQFATWLTACLQADIAGH
ncbi:LysR family transcriptional regulator [Lentibacter algarum]|uniref:LysR family transcriptional regulator n=1 Tax=Lentibacter algarum TaxID=576131 RepID=UPI001C0A1C0E|nr:LysR substrate-binding domain-containing protein [Lentibacter algarum]MBU2983036.1 LysR family transcriptional regulator [Lentibacter algarum]